MDSRFLVSILVGSFVLLSLASSAMAASGEVLVLHFDEGSGTVARDSSGYGNDGTIYGARWVNGKYGKALRFDGVDDYVQIHNNPNLNPKIEITISAWYKPVVSFKGAGVDPVVDKGYYSHTAPYYQYHLGVTGDRYETSRNSAFQFSIASDGAATGVHTGYNFWGLGTWYYLVGTYDGEMTKLYVNGELVSATQAQGEMMDYGKDLYIATYTNYDVYLPGTIDEVKIYNRALSAEEINELYEGEPATPTATPTPTPTLTPAPTPSKPDSDGDGWSDEKEEAMGTNPYSVDSDKDGLNDPQDPNPTVPEEKEETPGFEAVFALAGLLAMAYLVLRRR